MPFKTKNFVFFSLLTKALIKKQISEKKLIKH